MALDLTNGYQRKDSSSASNVYYGYTPNINAADGDKVFAIRRVNTLAGVETVTWTNLNQLSYNDSWSGRTYSFSQPGPITGLTWSLASGNYYVAAFTWSSVNGVSKYIVTATNSSNKILNRDGSISLALNNTGYTVDLYNETKYTQFFLSSGTYSLTVSAHNAIGSTSSTAVINFS